MKGGTTLMNATDMNNDFLCDYPPVLSVEQTAEILGVGKQLVRNIIADKKLPAIKVGRIYRIPKTKLLNYLNNTLDERGL